MDSSDNYTPSVCSIKQMFYIDTVAVYLGRSLPIEQQRDIQPDPKKIVYDSHPMKYLRPGYLVKVSLHRPTRDVLERLIKVEPYNIHLTEVAFARDEIFETDDEVRRMEDFYNHHITKKNHGKQIVKKIKRTKYLAAKNAAVNLATYGDKVSRFTGEPCLHSEMRFRYKKTLARIGIHGVQDISDLLSLSDRDIASRTSDLFDKYFIPRAIDRRTWIRIGQVITGETKRNPKRMKRYSFNGRIICQYLWYERVGRIFIRGQLGTEDKFEVQELKDLMLKHDKRFGEYLADV